MINNQKTGINISLFQYISIIKTADLELEFKPLVNNVL